MKFGRRLAAWGLVGAILPQLASAATPGQLLYERALMTAAGERCRLFAPAIASALSASAAQARGAALRSGDSQDDLAATVQRARIKAGATPCNSPDLKKAATHVTEAFEAFSQQTRQAYPGDLSAWNADRGSFGWLLSEPASMGADRVTIGYPASGGGLSVVTSFPDGRVPYAARLVLRDVARTQGAYLDRTRATNGGKLPYFARLAPASVTRSILAAGRGLADVRLLPAGVTQGLKFTFPTLAGDALAALDPREAVTVEFLFNAGGRETSRIAYVEVGDFAAARAFIAMAAA